MGLGWAPFSCSPLWGYRGLAPFHPLVGAAGPHLLYSDTGSQSLASGKQNWGMALSRSSASRICLVGRSSCRQQECGETKEGMEPGVVGVLRGVSSPQSPRWHPTNGTLLSRPCPHSQFSQRGLGWVESPFIHSTHAK